MNCLFSRKIYSLIIITSYIRKSQYGLIFGVSSQLRDSRQGIPSRTGRLNPQTKFKHQKIRPPRPCSLPLIPLIPLRPYFTWFCTWFYGTTQLGITEGDNYTNHEYSFRSITVYYFVLDKLVQNFKYKSVQVQPRYNLGTCRFVLGT